MSGSPVLGVFGLSHPDWPPENGQGIAVRHASLDESSLPKLIYFAQRHPSLDPTDFRTRWRQHGKLGMSLPRWRNVRHYAQCDRIRSAPDLASAPWDGVGVVIYRSEQARLAHVSDPDSRLTKADETATFAHPLRESSVLTTETILGEHRRRGQKLFVAVTRAPELNSDQFRGWWEGVYGPMMHASLRSLDSAVGYSQNHARGDDQRSGPVLLVDCVDEISSHRMMPILNAFLLQAKTLDFRSYVEKAALLLTEELVLYDDPT